MRVFCIGDSLSLPRKGCCYNETWFFKLRSAYPSFEFVSDFKGGRLVEDALHIWSAYYQYCYPDIVIIQEGVCDSSPRYINENKFYWKFLVSFCESVKLSRIFWGIVKLRKRSKKCTYTQPARFYNIFDEMIKSMVDLGVKIIIIIKIGHGAPSIVEKSKFFNYNVDYYNRLFDELREKYKDYVVLIDPLNSVEDDMFVDGYHCNSHGMNAVYTRLSSIFEEIVAKLKQDKSE